MRYKEFVREQSWSQKIGGPPTYGTAQDLAQSMNLIQQTKQKFRQQFNRDLKTTSEHRTRDKQAELFRRGQRGERGIYTPVNPDRYPTAEYFHLYSMDITGLNKEQEQWLNSQGWTRPDPIRDPVHYQYAGKAPTRSKELSRPQATQTTQDPDTDATGLDTKTLNYLRGLLSA